MLENDTQLLFCKNVGIQLQEDDPRVAEAMAHFMYGHGYDRGGSNRIRVSPF